MKYKEALEAIEYLVKTNEDYFSDGIDKDIIDIIKEALGKRK